MRGTIDPPQGVHKADLPLRHEVETPRGNPMLTPTDEVISTPSVLGTCFSMRSRGPGGSLPPPPPLATYPQIPLGNRSLLRHLTTQASFRSHVCRGGG